MRWHGATFKLERPVRLTAKRGLTAFNPLERAILRLVGVNTFLAMKKVQVVTRAGAERS